MATHDDRSGGRRRWGAALGSVLSYWLWRRWRGGGRRADARGPVNQRSVERGHEPEGQDENLVAIVGSGALMVVSVIVIAALLVGFIRLLPGADVEGAQEPLAWVEGLLIGDTPPPRLQVSPPADLQALHAWEHERLYTYGRIDSARLHIPIDRAMQLVAQRGLPADTSTAGTADTLQIPTESGFRAVSRRYPESAGPRPFLGSSPEPYTPTPSLRRYLSDEGYLPRADSTR